MDKINVLLKTHSQRSLNKRLLFTYEQTKRIKMNVFQSYKVRYETIARDESVAEEELATRARIIDNLKERYVNGLYTTLKKQRVLNKLLVCLSSGNVENMDCFYSPFYNAPADIVLVSSVPHNAHPSDDADTCTSAPTGISCGNTQSATDLREAQAVPDSRDRREAQAAQAVPDARDRRLPRGVRKSAMDTRSVAGLVLHTMDMSHLHGKLDMSEQWLFGVLYTIDTLNRTWMCVDVADAKRSIVLFRSYVCDAIMRTLPKRGWAAALRGVESPEHADDMLDFLCVHFHIQLVVGADADTDTDALANMRVYPSDVPFSPHRRTIVLWNARPTYCEGSPRDVTRVVCSVLRMRLGDKALLKNVREVLRTLGIDRDVTVKNKKEVLAIIAAHMDAICT